MTMPFPSRSSPLRLSGATRPLAIALVASVALLAGCTKKDKPATQTAVKVGKEEITVHQINYVVGKQRPPFRPSRQRRPAAQSSSA